MPDTARSPWRSWRNAAATAGGRERASAVAAKPRGQLNLNSNLAPFWRFVADSSADADGRHLRRAGWRWSIRAEVAGRASGAVAIPNGRRSNYLNSNLAPFWQFADVLYTVGAEHWKAAKLWWSTRGEVPRAERARAAASIPHGHSTADSIAAADVHLRMAVSLLSIGCQAIFVGIAQPFRSAPWIVRVAHPQAPEPRATLAFPACRSGADALARQVDGWHSVKVFDEIKALSGSGFSRLSLNTIEFSVVFGC